VDNECGDGITECTESCDDDNTNPCDGCAADCSRADNVCGDGIPECGEGCDDGNGINTDACPDGVGGTCQPASCGDTFVYGAGGEVCDDGGNIDCDGCTADCSRVDDQCGDGITECGEACDDDNIIPCDGCATDCSRLDDVCGDGIVECGEECEPPGVGSCDANCMNTSVGVCGDGALDAGENCDDDNTTSGDGCDDNCQTECGWTCAGEPSNCSETCGDGVKVGTEECDDGNTTSGDGCTSNCVAECSNGSTTDCNPPGETKIASSAWVDPDPPRGFIQCAGFENTAQDDVDLEWETNCYGFDATLRIRFWDTSTVPWTLMADSTLDPQSTADMGSSQEFTTTYDHGGTEGLAAAYMIKPQGSCIACGPPGERYGVNDFYAGNRADTDSFEVCSADGYSCGPTTMCGPDEELMFTDAAYGYCASSRPFFTDLAVAMYYRVPTAFTGLMIAQVFYDHTSTDDGYEWVQLYNNSACPIDLSGYSLGWGGSDYTYGTAQLSGTVNPYTCFMVGGPLSDAENGNPTYDQLFNFSPDLQNADTMTDGIALFDFPEALINSSSVPIDVVLYDSPNTNDLLDEAGAPGTPDVGDAGPGSALQRDDIDSWIIGSPNPASCAPWTCNCPARPNTTYTCPGAICTYACIAPWEDCDGDMTNGCEIPTGIPNQCDALGLNPVDGCWTAHCGPAPGGDPDVWDFGTWYCYECSNCHVPAAGECQWCDHATGVWFPPDVCSCGSFEDLVCEPP
jgi:cysteine-rich repeat protein